MTIDIPNNSERLFTEICNYQYLKGLVFHSPKIILKSEIEISDVLLWARTLLIDFELKWRNPNSSDSLKGFLKKIGKKRDQLERNHDVFKNTNSSILLKNENNKVIIYDNQNFSPENFLGIVLIDYDDEFFINYGTLKKAYELPFSTCFINFKGLQSILTEIDTIYDLTLYLKDRFIFYKFLLKNYSKTALLVNTTFEKNLLAFYKINNNHFSEEIWDDEVKDSYWDQYQTDFKEKRERRDIENSKSFIVDSIINYMFKNHYDFTQLPLHAWELSVLTRRQRATKFAPKLIDAFSRLKKGNEKRYFSFFNELTVCWILFYFRYGSNFDDFSKELDELCYLKTVFEFEDKNFKYSVFGYGFRKSKFTIHKDFDELYLAIYDFTSNMNINEEISKKASEMFGHTKEYVIKEFPSE